MERFRDFLRNTSQKFGGKPAEPSGDSGFKILTDINQPIPPTKDAGSFYNRNELIEEVMAEMTELQAAKEAISSAIQISSRHDIKRWTSLQQELQLDIDPIKDYYNQRLLEFDRTGSPNWYEVAVIHGYHLGSELVAQRNVRQQLALARKYKADDNIIRYLKLLEAHHAGISSLRIGRVAIADFTNIEDKKVVDCFDFLVKGNLAVYANLGDEIVQYNQDSSRKTHPNKIKSLAWVLPHKIQALFTLDPQVLEEAMSDKPELLREMGHQVGYVLKGIKEARAKMFRLILDPNSRDFPHARQSLMGYLEGSDRPTMMLALNILGLNQTANVQKLYLESRKHISQNKDKEFYEKLTATARAYAKDISSVFHIPDEADMELISDLDQPLVASEIPTMERLGSLVSVIFQKSRQRIYEVNPGEIDWHSLYIPQKVNVQFDRERPSKFKLVLGYSNEDGEEMDVSFGLDAKKGVMEWEFLADPNWPENERVDRFKSLLLQATSSILGNIQKQAQTNFDGQQDLYKPEATTLRPAKTKKERFEDPMYQLRKEVKAEQRQLAAESSPSPEDISLAEILQSTEVKNKVVIPQIDKFLKLMRHLSYKDQEIVSRALNEFNQLGTGGELEKMKNLGPDGNPRWSLRIACSVPKGVRVVLSSLQFSPGMREFEILDIRYRKDVYPRNKL